MPDIWEHNGRYNLLRPCVDACTRASYRHLRWKGSLPSEGAVIIAPNHTNTLMDALVVLQTRKEPTVFGARADIFRNPKAAAALRFLRILPMTRERDGLHSVVDNYKTFDEIDSVLEHGVPFCMFPEGRHRAERGLLPIQKGIARIAFRSAAERQTYVVPTGITYGDFFRYRSTCDGIFGEPIDVNAFLREREALPEAKKYSQFRELLSERILELVDMNPQAKRLSFWWILLFPLWVLAALLSLPIWLPAEWLCHNKLGDKAFSNSVRLLFRLVLTPVLLLVWALVLCLTMPCWLSLPLLILFLFSYSIFYDGLNWVRDHQA